MTAVRVQVLVRSPAVRAGLRALLGADGLEVTDAAPDVIVCDDATRPTLGASLGGPGVVLLSDDAGALWPLVDLEPRGWAVLPPDATAEELRAAVIAASLGLAVLPAHAAPALLRDDPEPQLARHANDTLEELTSRERDVLELLAHGLPNKRIARQLAISESTVKFHLAAIYAKLEVTGRVAAVNAAARRGLVTL